MRQDSAQPTFFTQPAPFWDIAVDLTEATNDGLANIGGTESPTYTSIAFTETQPDVITFDPDPLPTSGSHVEQISASPISLCSSRPAPVSLTASLPVRLPEAGGAVILGTSDSITSETKYLYGDVTVAGPGRPWCSRAGDLGDIQLRRRQGLAAVKLYPLAAWSSRHRPRPSA